MWHNILVEKEASTEVHKRETSLMLGPTLEESSHVSVAKNLDTSKRIADILRKKKMSLMMSNPRRYLKRKAVQPLLPMKQSSYSFARKRV